MLLVLHLNLGATGPDTTPDQFTFVDQTGVARNRAVESNAITVSGISAAASISVTDGYVSVNDGEYTDEPTTVNNGDTVRVKRRSSPHYATSVSATVRIGGVSDTFTITTSVKPGRRHRFVAALKRRIFQ